MRASRMRVGWGLTVLAAAVAGAPVTFAQARSPSLETYVTLASGYRTLGLSALDSGVSVQVGADYEHASGFFVGALAANVDYAYDTYYSERDSLLNVYAGYGWRAGRWRLNTAVHRYRYPGATTDYDYTSVLFGAAFRNRFAYTVAYSDRLYSRPYSLWHHEVTIAQPLRENFELSGGVGRSSSAAVVGGRYTHWNVGVSKILSRAGVDLRYYAATLAEASPLGDPTADRWVLSVSFGLSRR